MIVDGASVRRKSSVGIKVAVIGGGVGGCLTALMLTQKGFEVTLLTPSFSAPRRPVAIFPDCLVAMRSFVPQECRDQMLGHPLRSLCLQSVSSDEGAWLSSGIEFRDQDHNRPFWAHVFRLDWLGDRLSRACWDLSRASGLDIRHTPVVGIRPGYRGQRASIETSEGTLLADLVILAVGASSGLLERLHLPVRTWHYDRAIICANLSHDPVDSKICSTSVEWYGVNSCRTTVPIDPTCTGLLWLAERSLLEGVMAKETDARRVAMMDSLRPLLDSTQTAGQLNDWELGMVRRHLAPLVEGNVALVGDAAHTMPPLAAQGLNNTIADIAALSEAFSLKVEADVAERLEQYRREREWLIARSSALVHAMTCSILQGGLLMSLIRTGMIRLLSHHVDGHKRLVDLVQTTVPSVSGS